FSKAPPWSASAASSLAAPVPIMKIPKMLWTSMPSFVAKRPKSRGDFADNLFVGLAPATVAFKTRMPDIDFFAFFRFWLATIVTIYASVITLQSFRSWYFWLAGNDKYSSLLRRYLLVHGLRLRFKT